MARLALFGGSLAAAVELPALADDWQVTRSQFDPRLLAPMKAELRKRPEDLGLLRRLMALYRKHSTLDKLGEELAAQAARSGSGADYLLAAEFERERGRPDEASKLLQQATGRPGGPDAAKSALMLAELALRRSPPDVQAARRSLEGALSTYKPGDAHRPKLLRKLADIYSQSGETAQAAQSLAELLEGAQGQEAVNLRRERAEALSRANQPAAALAEWKKLASSGAGAGAVSRAEQRAEAELKVGELSEATRDDQWALAAYRRGLALLPSQHHLRRELYEHLIALHRKRDELPLLLAQLEKEWPAASRSFSDWELLGRLYDERGDAGSATAAFRAALRKEPHSNDIRRRLIAILERSGVTAEVLREYEQLIAQAPGDSRAYLELAERLDKTGQRQQALGWLRRAAARFAGDPSLHSALADIYQRWGEAELALTEAELLVRIDPKDESYVVNLGEMYWARGRKEKADEIWRRLLNLSPSKTLGQARLADVYAEHNLMPQAMELYQKAVRTEPNNLQLRRGLALCSERLNRPSDAVRHWEQIYFAARTPAERPLRMESRQHLGKLIRRETRLMPSLYSWQRRLQAQLGGLANEKLETADLVALGLLVADLDLQLGRAAESEAVLVQLKKDMPPGPLLAEVLLALVPVYQQQRKLDEAIAALKQAATMLPDRRRELYAQLAELSLQGYHDEDAVRYAQQAVVDAQGELRLGEIFERRDDNNAAMSAYRRAIELDGRLFRAHMALGRLHLGRGELTEAAAIYRDVVRQSPQEELVLEAGRKAIDLHEYLGTLGELLRELTPLAYSPMPKPVYRKLLLLLYERYATPLLALARTGDAAAQAELSRLGQSSFKPLAETLVDGDSAEQRLAVMLLGAMGTPGAAPALLNVVGPVASANPNPSANPAAAGATLSADRGPGSTHTTDIDLRVEALLHAARLEDPRSAQALIQLAQSREKQLRLGALYGLVRLAPKADKPATAAALTTAFDQAVADPRPTVKAMGYLGHGAQAAGRGLQPRQRTQILAIIEKRKTQPDEIDELAVAAAVHALGQARERAQVPLLIELLREGNDEVQRQAAWALGSIGDPRAVGPLLRAVFVKNEPIRQVAAAALHQLTAEPEVQRPKAPSNPVATRWPIEHRALDGMDVARWLTDAASFAPPPAGRLPLWLTARDAASLIAALDEALLLHRDVALRTLGDLLGPGAGSAATLPLGPLTAQLPEESLASGGGALSLAVAQGILPTLRRLVRAPAAGGGAADSGGDSGDAAVRDHALLLLGRLTLFADPALKQGAQTALIEVARSEPTPALALRAAEVLSAHTGELPAAERTALVGGLLDRLLDKPAAGDRWVRLGALEVAGRPGGAAFLSTPTLRRAAEDSDGFVREAAQRLLQQRK